MLIGTRSIANLAEQTHDCLHARSCQMGGRAYAIPLDKAADDLGTRGCRKVVHFDERWCAEGRGEGELDFKQGAHLVRSALIISWIITFIACVWTAAVGFSVLCSNGPSLSGREEEKPAANESKYSDNLPGIVSHDSASAPSVVIVPKTPIHPHYRAKKADRNPVQWGSVAEWATAAIAAFALGVGFWQLSLLREQIKTSQESGERQLRAYVGTTDPREKVPEAFPENYAVHIINAGQSPAYDVEGVGMWWTFEKGLIQPPADFTYPIKRTGTGSRFTLSAQGTKSIFFPLPPMENGITFRQQLEKANNGEITLFYYGTVFYRDVFKNTPTRTTNFCFRHMKSGEGKREVVVCSVHNEAT